MQTPTGITESKTEDGIELRFTRRRRRDIIPIAGTIFVLLVILFSPDVAPRDTKWYLAAAALTIWTAHSLVMVLNQTRISVNTNRLLMKHFPLALPPAKEFSAADISNVIVETHRSRFGEDASIHIKSGNQDSEPLVGRLYTAKAEYIAARIKEQLGPAGQ